MRERQYEQIKAGLEEQGRPESTAEEIAARTVTKARARSSSTQDLSSSRRGGLRSHRGPGGRTSAQLYADARRAHIKDRSTMTKDELEKALRGSSYQ